MLVHQVYKDPKVCLEVQDSLVHQEIVVHQAQVDP